MSSLDFVIQAATGTTVSSTGISNRLRPAFSALAFFQSWTPHFRVLRQQVHARESCRCRRRRRSGRTVHDVPTSDELDEGMLPGNNAAMSAKGLAECASKQQAF